MAHMDYSGHSGHSFCNTFTEPFLKKLKSGVRVNTRHKGRLGEACAIEHLLENGYSIMCQNYQTRTGEIDCVARDMDGTLVFLEVKSVRSLHMGNPLYKITPAKRKTLMRLARYYMAEHKITGQPCRFDVISIVNGKIDHLKNAFIAM